MHTERRHNLYTNVPFYFTFQKICMFVRTRLFYVSSRETRVYRQTSPLMEHADKHSHRTIWNVLHLESLQVDLVSHVAMSHSKAEGLLISQAKLRATGVVIGFAQASK